MTEPMRAFPSWFLRIECDRYGKVVMHNEAYMTDRQRGTVLRVLLSRMRHEGCGDRPARAELMAASKRHVGQCDAFCCWDSCARPSSRSLRVVSDCENVDAIITQFVVALCEN